MLLPGCEQLPPREGAAPLRPARAAIAAFSFDGRISVRHDETRDSVNIDWRHRPETDEILLTTSLGQGVAQLHRDAGGARLVKSDKEVIAAADWEELSGRVFGFPLPLSDLPRWLLADVAPSAFDLRGRPQAAQAAGWQIRYLDYESDLPGALPVLVELRRDRIELRLKVDTWRLE
ncbi:MAG: outer membrane lipoprotein LolB [Rhodocyclales bacterium]|nr:outer membrane lipoprotein LolB [Rhodocyclales bacterium]